MEYQKNYNKQKWVTNRDRYNRKVYGIEHMLREDSLEDISDGKIYGINDMVKADTNGCSGCQAACCHDMGSTIQLDPFDIYRLTTGLQMTFEQLMEHKIELNVVDGTILPNLKMTEGTNQCAFLNEKSRCDIHSLRPGICRLFPLGRYWQDETHFQYILQTGQCHKNNLTKIKVKKWLDYKDFTAYNEFLIQWHQYLKQIQAAIKDLSEEQVRILNMYTLKTFYIMPYQGEYEKEAGVHIDHAVKSEGLHSAEFEAGSKAKQTDSGFYEQFQERLKQARNTLGLE